MANAAPTYPGDRNNEPKTNNFPHRDIGVINHPAGGIEFVNTKDDEMVTFYHKNGSVIRFNKSSTDYLHTVNTREHTQGDMSVEVLGNVVQIYHQNIETINLGDSYQKVGDIDKWQSFFDQYKKLVKPLHDKKRLFELQRVNVVNTIDQAPQQKQSGAFAACPLDQTNSTLIFTESPTIYNAGIKEACLYTLPELIDLQTAYNTVANTSVFCPTCGGTHLSPSTQDGLWTPEPLKKTISEDRISIQTPLFEIEKQLGQNKHREGGSLIQKIAKDYVGVVGLTFNDFESFRVDPIGKMVPCALKIDPLGGYIQTQYRPSKLIEHVHVDKMPGGSYDLTCCDSYNLITGSNGINMKTSGPMEIGASIYTLAAEVITIGTKGEISFDSERFDVHSEIITLRPKKVKRDGFIEEQNILLDGNVGVSNNIIVRGGAHIEGELTVQSITAPMEIQITDEGFEWGTQSSCSIDPENGADCMIPTKSTVYGDITEGCLIGIAVGTDSCGCEHALPVYSVCSPNSVKIHPHYHYFKNLPLKLIRDNINVNQTVNGQAASASLDPNSVVRALGSRNNYSTPIPPHPVVNSKTNTSVLEKLGGSMCSDLTINEGVWNQSNTPDTLPPGEGTRTSNYTDAIISDKILKLEKLLETKYMDLLNKIDNLTKK